MARLPSVGGDTGNWGTILTEYLEVEHSADGSHSTSYLPLAGGTLSGTVDFGNNVLAQAEILDYSETAVTANSGAAYAVNLSSGNVFSITLTAACTLTLTNPPTTGRAASITLILTQDDNGNRVITWPESVRWAHGNEAILSTAAGAVDIIQLLTLDGGTTWYAFLAGTTFS